MQGQSQIVLVLPGLRGQQLDALVQVVHGGAIGGGRLGLAARLEVEVGQLLRLSGTGEARSPLVEVVNDGEQMGLPLLCRPLRQQTLANGVVGVGLLVGGNEGIGRLLDAIVEELVGEVGGSQGRQGQDTRLWQGVIKGVQLTLGQH